MSPTFRRIAILAAMFVVCQAGAAPARAGFLKNIVAGGAIEVGGAIALSLAAKHAADCYHDPERCARERELAGKLVKAIEAKLTDELGLDGTVVLSQGMKSPPKDLKGFPGSTRTKPKTPFAGGLRKRWKLASGGFGDWDYMHGEVEVYNDQGKHQGSFDPDTGEQIDPPDPTKTAPK